MIDLAHFAIKMVFWTFLVGLAAVITVSLLPKDNPLYQLLLSFTKKIAVTAGLMAIAVPIEFVPVVDIVYDIAGPLFLCWTWWGFFKEAISTNSPLHRRAAPVGVRQAPATKRAEVEVLDALPAPKARAAAVHEEAKDSYF